MPGDGGLAYTSTARRQKNHNDEMVTGRWLVHRADVVLAAQVVALHLRPSIMVVIRQQHSALRK